ncbi:ribonuclease H-like domain-containing protein [Gloeopeniophorella convolvens]|nr:ribonuclease H-like domain-containing protein [Gloeopeniophorella convolvens]
MRAKCLWCLHRWTETKQIIAWPWAGSRSTQTVPVNPQCGFVAKSKRVRIRGYKTAAARVRSLQSITRRSTSSTTCSPTMSRPPRGGGPFNSGNPSRQPPSGAPARRKATGTRTTKPTDGRASNGGNTNSQAAVSTAAVYSWKEFSPEARLYYTRVELVVDNVLTTFASHSKNLVIGIDFEWRPNFVAGQPVNPIALVQLAFGDVILLVQVSAMAAFPGALRSLLESKSSIKVGVGIQDDCKKLWKDHRVSVRNCVDLGLLARSVDPQWKGPYVRPLGLSRLAETYLDRRVAKGRVQRSNWEAALSEQQQTYAANDCHACLTLYRALAPRALGVTPVPEPECYTFHAVNGVLRDGEGRPWFAFNPHYDPGPPPVKPDPSKVVATNAAAAARPAVHK